MWYFHFYISLTYIQTLFEWHIENEIKSIYSIYGKVLSSGEIGMITFITLNLRVTYTIFVLSLTKKKLIQNTWSIQIELILNKISLCDTKIETLRTKKNK